MAGERPQEVPEGSDLCKHGNKIGECSQCAEAFQDNLIRGQNISGEPGQLKSEGGNEAAANAQEEKDIDPETEKEIAAITEANDLIKDGITADEPERIIEALEVIDKAPDTVTTVRQRDNSIVAAMKRSLRHFREGMLNVDNWFTPKDRESLQKIGPDVVKACRILWESDRKSLFKNMTKISEHFYHTHGLGKLVDKFRGTDRPSMEL